MACVAHCEPSAPAGGVAISSIRLLSQLPSTISGVNEFIDAKRRNWDDRVPIHLASDFYDVASFKAGCSSLLPIEHRELGDIDGKTLLHLQCHFGMDTLSWAREGAVVTGVDFSAPAIAAARSLARKLRSTPALSRQTSTSSPRRCPAASTSSSSHTACSAGCPTCGPSSRSRPLPQARRRLLPHRQPSRGRHAGRGRDQAGVPLPRAQPLEFESEHTYTDHQTRLQYRRTYQFSHGLEEIVGAAIGVGLQLDLLHEFTYGFSPRLPQMRKRADSYFELPENPLHCRSCSRYERAGPPRRHRRNRAEDAPAWSGLRPIGVAGQQHVVAQPLHCQFG